MRKKLKKSKEKDLNQSAQGDFLQRAPMTSDPALKI
jgi:hypothetical protein